MSKSGNRLAVWGTMVVLATLIGATAGSTTSLAASGRLVNTGTIDAGDVASLTLASTTVLGSSAAKLDKHEVYPPIVAGSSVIVATKGGSIFAFDAPCEGSCDLRWVAHVAGAIRRSPTVASDHLFVTTGPLVVRPPKPGRLYAFPLACGSHGTTCEPSWIGRTLTAFSAPPSVAEGSVYGTSDDGTLYSFPIECGSSGAACDPSWTAHLINADLGRVDTPVERDGTVFALNGWDRLYAFDASSGERRWVGRASGAITHHTYPNLMAFVDGLVVVNFGGVLDAYSEDCEPAAVRCDPTWTATQPDFLGGTPIAADGIVYAASWSSWTSGHISAYAADCGSGGASCGPLWSAPLPVCCTFEIVADGSLLVTTICTFKKCHDVAGVLGAYPADCGTGGATCEPSWTGPAGYGRLFPVIENGLLWVGTQDGRLMAVATDCASDGSACDPVWSWTTTSGRAISAPAISGDELFAASADGNLYGFELLGS